MTSRSVIAAILDRLPFLRQRRARVDRRVVLSALPVRNRLVEWSDEGEGGVILRVPRRRDGLAGLLNRVVAAPEHRQVQLDEVGSDVWRMCDGASTVETIIGELAKKYRLNRREVELSLGQYLKQLAQRRYIGLLAPPEPPFPNSPISQFPSPLTPDP